MPMSAQDSMKYNPDSDLHIVHLGVHFNEGPKDRLLILRLAGYFHQQT